MEREREAIANAKLMRRKLDRSIAGMVQVNNGTYRGNVDKPANDFTNVVFSTVRNGIESDEQARILRDAIKYMMTEEGSSATTLDDAIEEAFQEAVETVSVISM